MPRYLLLFLLLPSPLWSQEKDKKVLPGDAMIEKYLAAETDKLSKKFLDGAKTIGEWKEKRPRLYREYMDMLGLWPIPEKTSLKATVTGTFEHQNVVIENLHFQSIPGLYVSANFYRPRNPSSKKLPTILYVCGHSNRGRDGSKSAFQDHGMWFASNGYNCLILDTLQLAEIPGVHHGTYGRPWLHLKAYGLLDKEKEKPETRWWWHSLGYTPAGVEAWNGVRAIDYLITRNEVDPDRIGVTGISGGGAATFWIACADDRVKVAVPVSGMSDLESYVKNKVVNGHCDCMFLYNTYQWDWTTIAALVAPRPMLFANSDNDPIFPMDGNRRIFAKLQKIYEMYGQQDLVEEYVSKGGHAYRPDLRIAIFKFINKHLKGDAKAEVKDAEFEKIEGKRLRVFPTDADIPKDAINHRVDEVFVKRGEVKLPEEGRFEAWRKDLTGKVKERVFGRFPDKVPGAKGLPGGKGLALLETESDRRIVLATAANVENPKSVVFLFLSRPGKPGKADFLFKDFEGSIVIGASTNSDGTQNWTRKSPPNFVERSHALLGRTVDQGFVWDILSSIRLVKEEFPDLPLIVAGVGEDGILAAYAAILDPSIGEVVLRRPPTSHKDGPHFLSVLRVLDIPDALGLLAPRKLTIIGGRDRAFDRTEEIYRRAGAADKLIRK